MYKQVYFDLGKQAERCEIWVTLSDQLTTENFGDGGMTLILGEEKKKNNNNEENR